VLTLLRERYELRQLVGEDRGGALFRAWDRQLERRVSVKVLAGIPTDPVLRRRFERDVRVLSALHTQCTPELYEICFECDPPFVVVSEVRGETLKALVERDGPLDVERVLRMLRAFARTLGAAHGRGIVHGDLRPELLFLDDGPVPTLTGFGRAQDAGEKASVSDVDDVSSLSPFYCPDLFVQDALAPSVDVYGLAALAYFALTAHAPISFGESSNMARAIGKLLAEPPPPPSTHRPELARLDEVFARALAKKQEERPPSVDAFVQALFDARAGRSPRPRALKVPEVGAQLEGYTIVSNLGRGGMGTVLLAEDRTLGRRVAMKFLHALSESRRARFLDEARALATLRDPAVVQVYSVGEHDGAPFLVMEYVPGPQVSQLLDEGDLPLEDALSILEQTAVGVAAIHAKGLVHGDVKPSNVLVGPAFRVVVIDFGLARAFASFTDESVSGTPGYMAPELLAEVRADLAPRLDVYALGVMTYELLTGELPFDAPDPVMLRRKHLFEEVPAVSARRPELRPFDEVVRSAMAKDPAERTVSCDAFRTALKRAAREVKGIHPQPRILLVGAGDGLLELLTEEAMPRAERVAVERSDQARAALVQRAFDVVLLDADAEHVDASELAARIRADLARPPPILMITERDAEPDLVELDALGVRGVLRKPVDRQRLQLNLQRVVDAR